MCIISVFTSENEDFILTQNRDESYLRPTSDEIISNEIHNQIYFGPQDQVSGGTWLYYSEQYICCVLNGEYKKHSHNPPYKMSRGLLILEVLKYPSIQTFINEIDLKGIEPFTLLIIDRKSKEKIILVWDETTKHIEDLTFVNEIIRSSSPLYTCAEKEFHKSEISSLKNKTPSEIFNLHNALKLEPNNRFPTVQTTSISQLISENNQISLKFCPI